MKGSSHETDPIHPLLHAAYHVARTANLYASAGVSLSHLKFAMNQLNRSDNPSTT